MEIKLIGTDIDGVWTDAKMYYTNLGEHMISFSTYDGMAVELLQKNKTTLKHEALKSGLIKEKEYNKIVDPKKMIGPS